MGALMTSQVYFCCHAVPSHQCVEALDDPMRQQGGWKEGEEENKEVAGGGAVPSSTGSRAKREQQRQ